MNQDPLTQLRDIHAPAELANAWWPPALGWWLLLGIVIVLIYWALKFWRHQRQKKRINSAAIKEWQVLGFSLPCTTMDEQRHFIQACNRLLKQTALAKGWTNAAHLSGQEWCDFLYSKLPDSSNTVDIQLLAYAGYRPDYAVDDELQPLYEWVGKWIRQAPKANEV